jgi:hypothetical protein
MSVFWAPLGEVRIFLLAEEQILPSLLHFQRNNPPRESIATYAAAELIALPSFCCLNHRTIRFFQADRFQLTATCKTAATISSIADSPILRAGRTI